MTNYEEYLGFNEEKDREKQEKFLADIVINYELSEEIKSINSSKNLLIFAEPYCPDCRVLVAFVERIRKLNHANINVEYLSRKDNFGKLNMLSENCRIPSVFLVDGIKITKILEEYPEDILKNLTEELRYSYRKGEHIQEIAKDFMKVLKKG